jgi:hypothetical protein
MLGSEDFSRESNNADNSSLDLTVREIVNLYYYVLGSQEVEERLYGCEGRADLGNYNPQDVVPVVEDDTGSIVTMAEEIIEQVVKRGEYKELLEQQRHDNEAYHTSKVQQMARLFDWGYFLFTPKHFIIVE